MQKISTKTVGRLSQYRRILMNLASSGHTHVHSHALAESSGMSAAQVRRDLMAIDSVGTPANGYRIADVLEHLNEFFGVSKEERVALAGVGNLGRALLAYLPERRPNAQILAAFDNDPEKIHKEILGCTCYPLDCMEEMVQKLKISVGIIAVPADAAQRVADLFIAGGSRGILNFAPAPLRVPSDVYVEYIDITMMLDKVAYFASHKEPS